MKKALLAAAFLSGAAVLSTATSAAPYVAGTGAVDCTNKPSFDFDAALRRALKRYQLTPAVADAAWLVAAMKSDLGHSIAVPQGEAARSAAVVGTLMRRNAFVAAYLLVDFERMAGTAFARTDFAQATADYINISLQPMAHAPHYGSSTRGEPAQAGAESASLNAILARVAGAQRALGDLYKVKPIRWYVLSYTFGDPVGAAVSEEMVCSLRLSATALDSLNREVARASLTTQEREQAQSDAGGRSAQIFERLRDAAFGRTAGDAARKP